MTKPMTAPRPGSDEASKIGCQCPRDGNHDGLGNGGDGDTFGWIVSDACELHRIPALDVLLKACGVDGGGR